MRLKCNVIRSDHIASECVCEYVDSQMKILPSEPYHEVSASAMHMKRLFRGSGEEKTSVITGKKPRRRCNLPKPFFDSGKNDIFYRVVYFRRIRVDS
jgi:hypothetical protein